MSNQSYLESLQLKHKELHKTIEALEAEKAPYNIIRLRKKEKLAIKDKISKFSEK